MKYLAQCRTRRFSGNWTWWVTLGDPMDQAQADEWLELQKKMPSKYVDFRLLVVSNDHPCVFSSKSWFDILVRKMSF